jgi:DUF4097 and DUF4098 domain-containing protein YvlB
MGCRRWQPTFLFNEFSGFRGEIMKKHFIAMVPVVLLVPGLLFARVEDQFDRTLQVSGSVNFELTTGSGDVIIKTGGSNQVVVHGRVRSNNEWFGGNTDSLVHSIASNPPIEQNGSTIRIGYNLPEDAKHHISISYEVTVPADTTVQAGSGSGEVQVQGVRSPVKLHTGSGDIRVQDLGPQSHVDTGSGNIRAESVSAPFSAGTGSGDIQADLTGSGDVDAHTGSGGIRIRGINGGLKARTGSGEISADGSVKGPWQLHSGSGNIRLALSSNGGFNLDVHTSSGSIHSELPIMVQGTLGRRELNGSVRGGGPEVDVSTGSGDIHIR